MRLLFIALICCLMQLVHVSVSRAEPSFDCRKANTAVEKTICSDAALSSLDTQVTETFKRAQQRPGIDKDALLWGQRYWLKQRADACGMYLPKGADETVSKAIRCLSNMYSDRITELEAEADGTRLPDRDRRPCEAARPELDSSNSTASTTGTPVSPFKILEPTTGVDAVSLLKNENLADDDIRFPGTKISNADRAYFPHLTESTKPDLVLEEIGGTDVCHVYHYFLRSKDGQLQQVPEPDLFVYQEETGFCEATDTKVQFVEFSRRTYMKLIDGRDQILFFAPDRTGKLSLTCRVHASPSSKPIDFDVDVYPGTN